MRSSPKANIEGAVGFADARADPSISRSTEELEANALEFVFFVLQDLPEKAPCRYTLNISVADCRRLVCSKSIARSFRRSGVFQDSAFSFL